MTPEGSTHVDTFTGTTSSFSRTASGKLTVVAVVPQRVIAEAPGPAAKVVTLSRQEKPAVVRGLPDAIAGPAVPPVGVEPTL